MAESMGAKLPAWPGEIWGNQPCQYDDHDKFASGIDSQRGVCLFRGIRGSCILYLSCLRERQCVKGRINDIEKGNDDGDHGNYREDRQEVGNSDHKRNDCEQRARNRHMPPSAVSSEESPESKAEAVFEVCGRTVGGLQFPSTRVRGIHRQPFGGKVSVVEKASW